jgi:hypothetical protein
MTTLYMNSTMDKWVKGEPGASNGLIQGIVPFGGSAPPVPNPDKKILGGKGRGLQEMSSIGIQVPPGFTLTTPLCTVYQKTNDLPPELWDEVSEQIARLEKDMGRQFGDSTNPLLLSCRSGAAISMPGMMDTVLNVVRSTTRVDRVYFFPIFISPFPFHTGPQQRERGRSCPGNW